MLPSQPQPSSSRDDGDDTHQQERPPVDVSQLIQNRIQVHQQTRKQALTNTLCHLLRRQREMSTTSSNTTPSSEQEMPNDANDKKVEQVPPVVENGGNNLADLLVPPNQTVELAGQGHQELMKNEMSHMIEKLKPIFLNPSVAHKSAMASYGINSLRGLRHILLLITKFHMMPNPSMLKLAAVLEARYGSYSNAELIFVLACQLFEMGAFQWNNAEDVTELAKILSLLARHAPSPDLALYYLHECEQIALEQKVETLVTHVILACVIFNLVISWQCDTFESEEEKKSMHELKLIIGHYFNIAKNRPDYQSGDQVIQCIEKMYTRKSLLAHISQESEEFYNASNALNQFADDDDDYSDVGTVMSYSSCMTENISLSLSYHAESRKRIRNINNIDIQKCIKYGTRDISRGKIRVCDKNLIVVFMVKKQRIPFIITTLKCKSRIDNLRHWKEQETKEQNGSGESLIAEYCDYLMTSVFFGQCDQSCEQVLDMLLEIPPQELNNDELEILKDTLEQLFCDGMPAFYLLEKVLKVMMHFGIKYNK
nr:unnamed protein product [Naegleria fowleri]